MTKIGISSVIHEYIRRIILLTCISCIQKLLACKVSAIGCSLLSLKRNIEYFDQLSFYLLGFCFIWITLLKKLGSICKFCHLLKTIVLTTTLFKLTTFKNKNTKRIIIVNLGLVGFDKFIHLLRIRSWVKCLFFSNSKIKYWWS